MTPARSLGCALSSAAFLTLALTLGLVRSAHAEPEIPAGVKSESVPAAVANSRVPQLDLDALFTYSIGAQSALGGELLATGAWSVWSKTRVTGTLDVGLLIGYQAEPWVLAPWLDPSEASGSNHRLRLLPNVGHSFRFGARRQLAIGLHVYAGMVYWNSTGTIHYDAQNVHGSASVSRVAFDAGTFLRFTWRPHPVVGMALYMGAPFYGVTSSYAVDLFTVGFGLTFRLR